MKTFIIPWSPDSRDYTVEQLRRDLPNPDYGDFEWSAGGLKKASSGDNFFLVWMGREPAVVMKGFFLTDPDPREQRIALRPSFIALPETDASLFRIGTIAQGYLSGNPLPDEIATRLARRWERYLEGLGEDFFDGKYAERSRKPQACVDDAVIIAAEELYDSTGPDGEPLILHALRRGMNETDPVKRIAGFLRDVVDCAKWDAGSLRERGFIEPVVDLLVTG